MNWKKEAIEKLKNYTAMQRSLENLTREISVRKLSGDSAQMLRALEAAKCRAEHTVCQVENALDVLTDEEQTILRRMYICPVRGTPDDLCEELAIEHATLYRHRSRALQKFITALFGVTVA